jgi:hypothetical protein
MTEQEYKVLNFIRSNLNKNPVAYQLGFLQGFLAKQMANNPEVLQAFKQQIKHSQQ